MVLFDSPLEAPLTNPALGPRQAAGGTRGLACSASAPVLDHKLAPSYVRPQLGSKESTLARWVLPSMHTPAGRVDELRGDMHDEALARFVSEALKLSTPDALRLAVRSAVEVMPGANKAHFFVMRKGGGDGGDDGFLELLMSHGGAAAIDADPAQRPTVPLGEGLTGWAAKTGVAVVERDASLHTAYSRRYEQPLLGKAPVLCVPVKPSEVTASVPEADQLAGVLVLCGKFGSQFSALDLQLARVMLEVAFSRLASSAALEAEAAAAAQAAATAQSEEQLRAMQAELESAKAEAAALVEERDALRTQLEGTQEVHAQMMAAQDELVAQQTETQLQLQTTSDELDAVRLRERRLVPDLERWLGLSAQLGSLLAHARDLAAAAVERLPAVVTAAAAAAAEEVSAAAPAAEGEGEGGGGGGEGGEGAAGAEPPVAAVSEAMRLLHQFDATLERALPNLRVAQPWLNGLLRPLQRSLHVLARATDVQPDAVAATAPAAPAAAAPRGPPVVNVGHQPDARGKQTVMPVLAPVTKVSMSLPLEPPPRPKLELSVDKPSPPRSTSPAARMYESKLYAALGDDGVERMATEGTAGAVDALASRSGGHGGGAPSLAVDATQPPPPAPPAAETYHQFFPQTIRNALREDHGIETR